MYVYGRFQAMFSMRITPQANVLLNWPRNVQPGWALLCALNERPGEGADHFDEKVDIHGVCLASGQLAEINGQQ